MIKNRELRRAYMRIKRAREKADRVRLNLLVARESVRGIIRDGAVFNFLRRRPLAIIIWGNPDKKVENPEPEPYVPEDGQNNKINYWMSD